MKKQQKRGGKSRKSRAGENRKIRPPRVQFEFTDLDLTAFGGASVLAQTAQQFGLFELLDGAVSVKVRNRGATDVEMLWSIISSLARRRGFARLHHGIPHSREGEMNSSGMNLHIDHADPASCPSPGVTAGSSAAGRPAESPPRGAHQGIGRIDTFRHNAALIWYTALQIHIFLGK